MLGTFRSDDQHRPAPQEEGLAADQSLWVRTEMDWRLGERDLPGPQQRGKRLAADDLS